MKKIILFALTISIAFSFFSCNTAYGENFIRNVYPEAAFTFFANTSEDNDFQSACEITDISILKLYDDSFTAVTEFFNVTAEQPPIKWYDNQNNCVGAIYNHIDGTIYINRSALLSDFETALVHEIVHYVAANHHSGIVYDLDVQGNTAVMGLKLNEGLTEYFAQKIKPFDYVKNKMDVYHFESHIAKALSAIVGEEKLKEIYINNSYQELKDLFNKHLDKSFSIQQDDIKLDTFDFFCVQVDEYFYEYDEFVKGLRMNSIIDELLIIGKGEGKEKEVKKIINEFDKSFSLYLPSSYIY